MYSCNDVYTVLYVTISIIYTECLSISHVTSCDIYYKLDPQYCPKLNEDMYSNIQF